MNYPDFQPDAVPSAITPRDIKVARQMLARLRAGKDLRQAKVQRLKQAIECGDYENSLKLDVAAERVVEAIHPPKHNPNHF